MVYEDPGEEQQARGILDAEDCGQAGVHGHLGRVVRTRYPLKPVAPGNGVRAATVGPVS